MKGNDEIWSMRRTKSPTTARKDNLSSTPIPNPSLGMEVVWVCAAAGMIACLYAATPNVDIWLAVTVLCTAVIPSTRIKRMRAVDWALLAICGYEVLSLWFSQYRANSVYACWTVGLSALLFLGIRLATRTPLQVVAFAGLVGLGGAGLALSGLFQFDHNVTLLQEAGLTDLVGFRSRLMSPPSPWVLGEWLTLLLLALPFACALPAYLWRQKSNWPAVSSLSLPVLIAATLTLSCSRAVFWSVICFGLATCLFMTAFRVIKRRTAGLLLASSLAVLTVILACESALYPGIITAYSGRHMSQVRSTEGRVGILERSLKLVRRHPFVGIGSSNAALALMSSAQQDEATGFASRTFSLPVQVLVEKGSIGLAFYAIVLVLIAREFVRTMLSGRASLSAPHQARRRGRLRAKSDPLADDSARKAMACCFAAGLLAVLVRELAYSSVLEHTVSTALLFSLAALVCSPVEHSL